MTGLRERLEADELLFDSPITQHGFASFMRDYDVVIDVPAVKPDGSGSYIIGQYRYRFTQCVEANIETAIPPETWRRSWSDEFTDYAAGRLQGIQVDSYGESSGRTPTQVRPMSRSPRAPLPGPKSSDERCTRSASRPTPSLSVSSATTFA